MQTNVYPMPPTTTGSGNVPGLMSRLDQRTQELNHEIAQLESALLPVLNPSTPEPVGGSAGTPVPDILRLERIDERLALLIGRVRTIASRVAL